MGALVTRVEPINDWLGAAIVGLSAAAVTKAVIKYAASEIVAADAINLSVLGYRAARTLTVNGQKGAALETYQGTRGRIEAEWELTRDVVRWIGETLEKRSPIVSGAYLRGHMLLADGRVADFHAVDIPTAAEYVFFNIVPYARKIEIGKTRSGRAFVIQVEPKIYERTAADAAARFGNVADIRFEFRSPPGGGLTSKQARRTRAPTIIVRPR